MSLTQELRNPKSAISIWLDENFYLDDVIAMLASQADEAGTLRPKGRLANYPWSTVGSAVEFRLRQFFGTEYEITSASLGEIQHPNGHLLHSILGNLWEENRGVKPTTKANAWVLYFAGLLEDAFRSGSDRSIAPYYSAIAQLDSRHLEKISLDNTGIAGIKLLAMFAYRESSIEELMEQFRVSDDVLTDIMTVGDAALDSADCLLAVGKGKFLDNPIFSGATWVGGADGDFMFGRALYDVKTTIHPENLWTSAIRQLLSYVALDGDDLYQIDELAIFLPRQNGLIVSCLLHQILADSAFSSRASMQASARKTLAGGR